MADKFVDALNLQKDWNKWKQLITGGKLKFKADRIDAGKIIVEVTSDKGSLPDSMLSAVEDGLNAQTVRIGQSVEDAYKTKVQTVKTAGRAEAQEVLDSLTGQP